MKAFSIDAIGDYMARDGSRVTVHEIAPIRDPLNWQANVKGSIWRMFRGKVRPKGLAIWKQDGRALPLRECSKDVVSRWYGHAFPCTLSDLDRARVHVFAEAFGRRYYAGGFETIPQAEAKIAEMVSEYQGVRVAFYGVDSAGSHFMSAPIEDLARDAANKESK